MQEKMTQKDFLTQKWHFEEEKTWKIPILSQYTTLYSIWWDKAHTFKKITNNIIILHLLDRCTVRFFTQNHFMKRNIVISDLYNTAQQLKTIYKINKTMFLKRKAPCALQMITRHFGITLSIHTLPPCFITEFVVFP